MLPPAIATPTNRARLASKGWLVGLASALVLASAAPADVQPEWVQFYNNIGGHDTGRGLVLDSQGDVIVTGSSLGFVPGFDYTYEFGTVKYTAAGTEVWTARYNGPGTSFNDEPVGVGVDSDDNVYVSGSSPGLGTDLDIATVKYTPAGAEVWVRRWNGPSNRTDGASAMAVDGNGNVYVTGGSYSPGSVTDMITLKYDRDGNLLWSRTYHGGYGTDAANAIALGPGGSVYVTGQSIRSSGFYDWATIKYDADGNEQWVRFVDGFLHSHDYAHAVAVDDAGNAIVTGYTVGAGSSYVLTTVGYSPSGTELWSSFSRTGEVGSSITIDSFGNSLVGCWSGLVVCYDPDGAERWSYDFGGTVNARVQASTVDLDGNWYVTGYAFLESPLAVVSQDILTVMIDPDGHEVWWASYDGPSQRDDGAVAIAVAADGDVLVSGSSDFGLPRNLDYCTIRYPAATTGVPSVAGVRSELLAIGVSPQPARHVANLDLRLPAGGTGVLSIVDAAGRRVARFAIRGDGRVSWSPLHHGSGIYWAILESGGLRASTPLAVVR